MSNRWRCNNKWTNERATRPSNFASRFGVVNRAVWAYYIWVHGRWLSVCAPSMYKPNDLTKWIGTNDTTKIACFSCPANETKASERAEPIATWCVFILTALCSLMSDFSCTASCLHADNERTKTTYYGLNDFRGTFVVLCSSVLRLADCARMSTLQTDRCGGNDFGTFSRIIRRFSCVFIVYWTILCKIGWYTDLSINVI